MNIEAGKRYWKNDGSISGIISYEDGYFTDGFSTWDEDGYSKDGSLVDEYVEEYVDKEAL